MKTDTILVTASRRFNVSATILKRNIATLSHHSSWATFTMLHPSEALTNLMATTEDFPAVQKPRSKQFPLTAIVSTMSTQFSWNHFAMRFPLKNP